MQLRPRALVQLRPRALVQLRPRALVQLAQLRPRALAQLRPQACAAPSALPMSDRRRSSAALTAATAKALYDHWALLYDCEILDWGYTAHTEVARMLAAAGYGSHARVLDLACGTGLSAVALHDAGIGTTGGIVGVDISEKSLDVAEKKGVFVECIPHDLEKPLPFGDTLFDAVICVAAASCIEDFGVHLGEAARVAKPGALIAWTHDCGQWAADARGAASAAADLEERKIWRRVRCDPPRPLTPHMPASEDPEGSSRTYHLIVYRKLFEEDSEVKLARMKRRRTSGVRSTCVRSRRSEWRMRRSGRRRRRGSGEKKEQAESVRRYEAERAARKAAEAKKKAEEAAKEEEGVGLAGAVGGLGWGPPPASESQT